MRPRTSMTATAALVCAVVFSSGCREAVNPVAADAPREVAFAAPSANRTAAKRVIMIPANSVDALQAALAQVASGGAIVLRRGTHTEHQTVTITKPVTIAGETGAVVYFDTAADPLDVTLQPALYVRDTDGVSIGGLEIRPLTGSGNTAILVRNAPGVNLRRNSIHDHQNSIVIDGSDFCHVTENVIVSASAWRTGALAAAEGIVFVKGANPYIDLNECSDASTGVRLTGPAGRFLHATIHNCADGIVLGRVPAGRFRLADGTLIGNDDVCDAWTVQSSSVTANSGSAFVVIDGARGNTLNGNTASGNARYDYELVGSTTRLGYCAPGSHDNIVYAETGNLVKDCGDANSITGGLLVDTNVDPCDVPCSASVAMTRHIR